MNVMISAVIVSYNTRDLTLECLQTLGADLAGVPSEIFVVDNASTDGSVEAIRAAFPSAHVLANSENVGFGAANNQAMRRARGKYFLLLNSDAFPRPGAIPALMAYLDQNPTAGVAGPRLLNRDGTLQRSCYHFPTPGQAWRENLGISRLLSQGSPLADYRDWDHASEREVDFMIGACLLVRREVFGQLGGFDERFFMYQEEADWQRRINGAGWRVQFTPSAEVVHFGGESGKREQTRVNQHFFESLDKYALKHHGVTGFLLIRLAMLVGCSVRAILWLGAVVIPGQRERATGKALKHFRLVLRQISTGRPA